jgi:hypothetical protein
MSTKMKMKGLYFKVTVIKSYRNARNKETNLNLFVTYNKAIALSDFICLLYSKLF